MNNMTNRIQIAMVCIFSFVFFSCRESAQLIPFRECEQGYTQSCVASSGCEGTQACGTDGFWDDCKVPGAPISCAPKPKPVCDETQVEANPPSCYDGPSNTRFVGICHPGWRICRGGQYVCAFQQTPQSKNCDNGQDNNCDGTVDAVQNTQTPTLADVVLMIDTSGSMQPYFEVIKKAIVQFTQAGSVDLTHIRIAVVGVPYVQDQKCGLISDFAEPSQAAAVVGGLMLPAQSLGDEPSIDCPALAANSVAPLTLSYRPGSKVTFISFSDEIAQSYQSPKLTALDSGRIMASKGIRFFSFDMPEYRNTFRSMVQLTGGASLDLNRDYSEIQQDLVNLFQRISCGT